MFKALARAQVAQPTDLKAGVILTFNKAASVADTRRFFVNFRIDLALDFKLICFQAPLSAHNT
jgi:hypothetical protein